MAENPAGLVIPIAEYDYIHEIIDPDQGKRSQIVKYNNILFSVSL